MHTEQRSQVDNNPHLSQEERERTLEQLAKTSQGVLCAVVMFVLCCVYALSGTYTVYVHSV